MIFSLERERERDRGRDRERDRESERQTDRQIDPIAFGKKTGNNCNENDQILYNAFYSSSQRKKKW